MRFRTRPKIEDVRDWHRKFALLPRYIEDTQGEKTVIWLEHYKRRLVYRGTFEDHFEYRLID